MHAPVARLILHPTLPRLLLLLAAVVLPVAAQQGDSSVKVEIAVEDATTSLRDVFLSPASAQPDIDVSTDALAPNGTPDSVAAPETNQETIPEGEASSGAQVTPKPEETWDAAVTPEPEGKPKSEIAVEKTPRAEQPAKANAESRRDQMLHRNLALGQELLAESKYLTIPGPRGSALNAFRKALAADPSNQDAQAGIQAIVARLLVKSREAYAAGNASRARDLLRSAENIVEPFVDRSGVEALRAEMASAEKKTAPAAPHDEEVAAVDTPADSEATSTDEAEAIETAAAEPKEAAPEEVLEAVPATAEEATPDIAPEPAEVMEEEEALTEDNASVMAQREPVQPLSLPPLLHVGQRIHVTAPPEVDGAMRWAINEKTASEAGGVHDLDYIFTESDLGPCRIQVVAIGTGGESAVRAEGQLEVKLFQDNPIAVAIGEPVELDPRRHGPVEGEYQSYAWRVDGEDVSTDPTLQVSFSEPGSHRVACWMEGPESESDRQWPAPVLAWEFQVTSPTTAVASSDSDRRAVATMAARSGRNEPERQSNLLLVILGAAVIVLALSQAWMAYRLNALARATRGSATPTAPKPAAHVPAALGTLPPEEEYMEELHQRFGSNETAQE